MLSGPRAVLTKVSAAGLIGCESGQFSRVDIGRDNHTEICPHRCNAGKWKGGPKAQVQR